MAEYLLEQGADPNASHPQSWPAIFTASLHGHARVIKALKEKGADFNVRHGRSGSLALHFCAERGHLSAVREVLTYPGIDIDHVNKAGLSALHLAAKNGHEDAVRTLLAAKANVSLASGQRVQTERYEIGAGGQAVRTEIALEAHDQSTALHFAAANGHESVVRLLLLCGAPIDMPRVDQKTALHLAAAAGSKACAQLLVKAGADPMLQDADGKAASDLI